MKAAVLLEKERIVYQEVAEPTVGDGQVKVKVRACGICGSDLPRVFDGTARSYPLILGHEFSGTVAEVGKDVTGFTVGEHVVAAPLVPCGTCEDCRNGDYALCKHYSFIGSRQNGAFADYIVVPAANVVKIPEALPFEQAATIEPATVALHALRHIHYESGQDVAVLGCGIIGLYMVQWARALGAKRITVVGRGEQGLAAAKRMGADETVSTKDEGAVERLVSGKAFRYVFECSGATPMFQLMLELVKNKGTICMVGTPKRTLEFTVPQWEQINRRECWVTGSWMSYSAPFPGEEWSTAIAYMSNGKLRYEEGLVGAVYPMAEAMTAFQRVRNGELKGRVLLSNEKTSEA